jgi:hypothetical protein
MTDPQLDTLIRAYAEAKDAKDAADQAFENIRQHLLISMDEEAMTSYTGAFARVSICERKSYAYPDNVVRMEELLKAEKKAAERTGYAQIRSVTRYPRVTMTE